MSYLISSGFIFKISATVPVSDLLEAAWMNFGAGLGTVKHSAKASYYLLSPNRMHFLCHHQYIGDIWDIGDSGINR